MAVTFLGYDVYRGHLLNGSDLQFVTRVDTVGTDGQIDPMMVDVDPALIKAYRVKAVFSQDGTELATEFSDLATATQFPNPVDDKPEPIDGKLFVLDESLLDEGLLI
jgi:hypothetical protein